MGMRIVDNLLDFNNFRLRFNHLARMQVPAEYMNKCKIFGWYNKKGQIQGGYAFALSEDMAWPKL